jgi:RimJ/RimL family protein N-acetyltransferase
LLDSRVWKVGCGTLLIGGDSPMSTYPSALATEVVTDSGIRLSLRPIRPDDATLLEQFHERLSSHSIYRRYFSLHPVLSERELRFLTEVDYITRFAFVVENLGELIGVGRFDRVPETSDAEVAFIVADEFHHLGIGLMLLERLADVAWSLGITSFSAETQADNRSMMAVFRASGFVVSARMEDEIISARFSIQPTTASNASRASHRRAPREVAKEEEVK